MNEQAVILHDWRQTAEDVYIDLNVGPHVQKEDVNLKVDGRCCCCKLTDGRKWSCDLCHDVIQSSTKVSVKDGALTIHLQKQEKFKEWTQLIQECGESKPGTVNENSTMEMTSSDETSNAAENVSMVTDPKGVGGGGGEGAQDGLNEEPQEEEEYVIDHVKHDFFPKQDLKVLYLHMYVKKIRSDSVKVTFKEDEICIRFKTSDNQFLQLNKDSTPDTLFCWKIKPWRAIDPEKCLHKVSKSNLEVHITKQVAEKWKALECSSKDSVPGTRPRVASQGDWVPLSGSRSSPSSPSSPSPSSSRDHHQAEMAKDEGSEKDALRGAVGGAKSVEIKEGGSARTKKPTCTVPPLSLGKQAQPPPAQPAAPVLHQGYCGLDNLGNTCFMNSVLQVLANTRELKDYMQGADFKNEINRDNPLGSGGHLVLSFAVLMRRLWGGQHKSIAPSKLKSIISAKASQFMGFAQHDAQEFMAFLLDGLHEDINRIRKKPYTETVDSDGRPDQVVADEAWKTHRRRNDSFIVDLFQGQYKSKLVCPDCNKVSITFDPFMHLSMPLPKKKRHLPVYFFSRDCHQRPVRCVVSLAADATVHDLTVQVAHRMRGGVNAANLRVFEVHRSCVHKVFSRRSGLSGVSFNDTIFVQEVLSPAMAGEAVVEIAVIQRMLMPQPHLRCSHCKRSCEKGRSLKRCTKCYRAAYCDQACQKNHWNLHKQSCKRMPEPVGHPFLISLPKSHATYARLCQLMESYARYSTNVFVPPLKAPASHASPVHSAPCDRDSAPSTSTSTPQSPLSTDCRDSGTDADSSFTDATDTPAADSPPKSDDRKDDKGRGGRGGNTADNRTWNSNLASTKDDGTAGGSDGKGRTGVRDEGDGLETRRRAEGGGGGSGGERDGRRHSSESQTDGAATATVVGQPQMPERKMPLFFIKPASHLGSSVQNKERLKDEGDNPLDLSGINCLAMDWRNDPKQENNVLVETKSLDHVEDESCTSKSYEDKELSLEQCLNLFTEPEKLSPEEAWYCPKCKQHREATKQMLLWRLPSTLIIQLKRFSFGNMLWRDKIDKMVEYPVRGLDLSPYCHGNHSSPLVYDLYGVINHHGGILGGHYTAFGRLVSTGDWSKNEHDWRLFDDNHVSPMSEKNAVARSAYLLFYRRRQPYAPYIWRGPVKLELDPAEDQEEMDDKSSSSSSCSEMEVGDGDANKGGDRVHLADISRETVAEPKAPPPLSPPELSPPDIEQQEQQQPRDNRLAPGNPRSGADDAGTHPLPRTTEVMREDAGGEEGGGGGGGGRRVGESERDEKEDIGYTDMEDID